MELTFNKEGDLFLCKTNNRSNLMNSNIKLLFVAFLLNLLTAGIIMGQNTDDKNVKHPVFELKNSGYLNDWFVLGPFANQLSDEPYPDGTYQGGLNENFLLDFGLDEKKEISIPEILDLELSTEKNDEFQFTRLTANDLGIVDYIPVFGEINYKTAYAFSFINSEKDQNVAFLMGSDDGVKVWINGDLVHMNDTARGIRHRDDHFTASLKKGYNSVLVKITQYVRGWGFVLEALDEDAYEEYLAAEKEKQARLDFLNISIAPANRNTWNTIFTPGDFPVIEWENKYLVEKLFGDFPLKIRWFNNELKEVNQADFPGRYGCYVEGKAPDGTFIRRARTFYCMPEDWIIWGERLKADLQYIPDQQFNKELWQNNSDAISYYTGRIALLSMLKQEEGAILLSYLDEMGKDAALNQKFSPGIADHEFHLAMKRKILDVEEKWQSLEIPKPNDKISSPLLQQGSELDAGFAAGTADAVKQICKEWYDESGEPFVLLIARHGQILLHEAFGERPDGKVTVETMTEMASTTKMLTGLLFAQFLDQGLLELDTPIGEYIPDYPTSGEKVITLRQCFTHTAGLWSHEEWGGVHNPWLDNSIANILPLLEVGKIHEYNGMGYDLAGKVMEVVSGKSIFRLFRENFFEPLDLKHTVLEEDLAFSCHSTARDMAVIGQMLLNKGSYGKTQFFSEKTYEELLPRNLSKYYPGIDVVWGIGITPMNQLHPDAGKEDIIAGKTLLSDRVIGHGSATSAILRVDTKNDIVISQTRRRGGKKYEYYLAELYKILDEALIK